MTTDAIDLLDMLPHREPFRFLTRVDSIETGVSGRGVWQVTGDEEFLKGHFPDQPIVPGVLITESLAQLSGVVAFLSMQDQSKPPIPGMLVQADVRWKRSVEPPAEIQLKSTVTRSIGRLWQFDVTAKCDEQLVAKGSLTLAGGEE